MIQSFNEEAYLEANPKIKAAIEKGTISSALEHLKKYGLKEIEASKRKFHKNLEPFSETTYLKIFPEVEALVKNGEFSSVFEHFCKVGYRNLIENHLFQSSTLIKGFDEEAYLGGNIGVKKSIETEKFKSLEHYMWVKGLKNIEKGLELFHKDYYPFDEKLYLEFFPDVKDAVDRGAFISGFQHFCRYGYQGKIVGHNKWPSIKEMELLDTEFYAAYYNDLKDFNKLKLIRHWKKYGGKEKRYGDLNVLCKVIGFKFDFDKLNIDMIKEINPLLSALNKSEIFIKILQVKKIDLIRLSHDDDFDARFYLELGKSYFISGEKELSHQILLYSFYLNQTSECSEFLGNYYIDKGQKKQVLEFYEEVWKDTNYKYHPNVPFDSKWYINYYPDVKQSGLNPLVHYIRIGKNNGYATQEQDIEDVVFQMKKIIRQRGLFNDAFYLKTYPDLDLDNMDPLLHYIMYGAKELRDPSETFSTSYYLGQYPEVLKAGINPLVHYILVGEAEKRKTVAKEVATGKMEFYSLPLVSTPLEKINLKIAVVIHAFYIDVLEDIISSIDHISPRPDLFISVSEDADVKEIETFLKERGYKNFSVKPVQNRGRDVAPFLVEFADALKSYDLCCKIHGKKSLYGGSEQTNWRNHLYHNLLGSKEIVNDILSAFSKNEKLGLLFSDNYGMIPYWGYTWLTNKGVVGGLLQRLKLQELAPILDQTYIDYPAGTMFWFRPKAISQILDSGIGYEDFPEEPIGNDGTIAHGLERLFGYVTRLNGYDYIEQNRKLKQYTKNATHKNFNQHQAKTLETAKNIVSKKECIIFDIFDTLVTRTIFYPDNLFRIIEQEFDKKFSLKSDFMKVRKETEYKLRMSEEHEGDVSYDDIYDHIHLYSDYTPEMVEYLRTKDFAYELEILIPKPDTIELLKHAYEKDIEILFVSDMYLTKSQVIEILKKQDIPFKEDNLLVSSDTGYRKDNTTVWKHLVDTKRIEPSKTLMIGDSEVSDAKLPGDFAIGTFHVLSERNAFFESPFGKEFSQRFGKLSEKEMLLMGPVVNQLFSSAFDLSETVLEFSNKCTPYSFGYTALAPFFYMFIDNIYQKFSDKRIFFLARDGYFMQQAFETFLETKELAPQGKAEYLHISRRAMLGAVLKNKANLANMILDLGPYKGMFSAMIYSRVGLDESFLIESGIDDFKITGREGLKKAYEILLKHIDLINTHAKDENSAYLTYLENIGFFEESEDVLIDLGYSGTIQNYLHQLTGEKLIGEYFATTEKVSRVENENNRLEGYFADKIDPLDNRNIVYKYALVLEAFLTSDKGQLICYTEEEGKIIPNYKEKSESIDVQMKIMDGIRDYISALSIVPTDFIDTKSDRLKEISLFTYEYMIRNRLLDDEVLSILHLEDEFTGNKALDIMTILSERGI